MFTTSLWASMPANRASVTEVAVPEDFLGLFRSESDGIILQPGQELFKKEDLGYQQRPAPPPLALAFREVGL